MMRPSSPTRGLDAWTAELNFLGLPPEGAEIELSSKHARLMTDDDQSRDTFFGALPCPSPANFLDAKQSAGADRPQQSVRPLCCSLTRPALSNALSFSPN